MNKHQNRYYCISNFVGRLISRCSNKYSKAKFWIPWCLLKALRECENSGTTPYSLNLHMIKIYASTNGRIHDLLFLRLCREKSDQHIATLSNTIAKDLAPYLVNCMGEAITDSLKIENDLIQSKRLFKANGYIDLPFKISTHLVDSIVKQIEGSKQPCFYCRTVGGPVKSGVEFKNIPFNAILAQVFTGNISDNLSSVNMNELNLLDLFFQELARYFMNSRQAIKKHSSILWTFPSEEASDECAQRFHFDCDSIKWIKFFVYLSDVNEDNGPHVAVIRSHLPGSKSENLMNKGYVRHTDSNIMESLKDGQKTVHFCRPKGSIIVADTRCWHKGTPVVSGRRVMMDFVYLAHQLSRVVLP